MCMYIHQPNNHQVYYTWQKGKVRHQQETGLWDQVRTSTSYNVEGQLINFRLIWNATGGNHLSHQVSTLGQLDADPEAYKKRMGASVMGTLCQNY